VTAPIPYSKGLHDVGNGHFAYLQPDGSWGLSNAGLITHGGQSLLVDTLFDLRLTAEMLGAMRRASPAAASIGALVNSHSNGDHTFGNRLVAGARVIASRRAAEEMVDAGPDRIAGMMRQARTGALGPTGEYLKRIFGAFDFDGIDQFVLPTETFEGALELDVGGKSVRLIEVGPAHTGGDVIVFVPADRVVYAADILFIGGHPVAWAGPVTNWIKALDLILGLNADVVVPGHGPVPSRRQVVDLKEYWEYLLRECRARLESGQPAGDAARELAGGPYCGWGESERMIINVQTIYRELEGQAPQPMTPIDRFRTMAEFEAAA
jgi:cyclase